MKLNVFFFYGKRDHYRHTPMNLASLGFMVGDDWYGNGAASENDSLGFLFSTLLPQITAKIEELAPETKEITLVPSPTIKSESDEFKALLALATSVHPQEEILKRIKQNSAMDDVTKTYLILAESMFRKLKDMGISFSVKYKESKETIAGILQADAAADRAFFRKINNIEMDGMDNIIVKERRARTKDIPNLLLDNIIFNWGVDELDDLAIYYTGNGELENKRPKGEKIDKVTSKAFVYFTGNNQRLRVLGKLSAEDRYNVVVLKKKCDYLTKLFDMQREVNKSLYSTEQMTVYRRDVAFSAGTSADIESGSMLNFGVSDKGDIYTTTLPRKDLSYVFNPPRLAFKIKRELENNMTRLVRHIRGQADSGLTVTDLTSVFFDKEGDKCTLAKTLATDAKVIKLEDVLLPTGKTTKMKMAYKFDLPEIRDLKKLLKEDPKIELVCWMHDELTVAYAIIVTTSEGWLWYCSQYGGRHLLRGASKKNRK